MRGDPVEGGYREPRALHRIRQGEVQLRVVPGEVAELDTGRQVYQFEVVVVGEGVDLPEQLAGASDETLPHLRVRKVRRLGPDRRQSLLPRLVCRLRQEREVVAHVCRAYPAAGLTAVSTDAVQRPTHGGLSELRQGTAPGREVIATVEHAHRIRPTRQAQLILPLTDEHPCLDGGVAGEKLQRALGDPRILWHDPKAWILG